MEAMKRDMERETPNEERFHTRSSQNRRAA